MIRFAFFSSVILLFSACSEAAAPDVQSADTQMAETVIPESIENTENSLTPDDNASFEDVLNEYQALNARLEQIAYRLQSANVDLCPRKRRDPGFTVHTAADYPDSIREIARALLPVDDGLTLRTVRAGSPADNAGLQSGDRLLRLGDFWLPRGRTAAQFYRMNRTDLLIDADMSVEIERGENRLSLDITPETICRYPVSFIYSQYLNARTDGEEVYITTELMRSLDDDVSVALVIAHEMAHAIAGHIEQYPSKSLEFLADRMALIMLERAGYDIDKAIEIWNTTTHPVGNDADSLSHPAISERSTHFEAVRRDIRERQAGGETLDFKPWINQ